MIEEIEKQEMMAAAVAATCALCFVLKILA